MRGRYYDKTESRLYKAENIDKLLYIPYFNIDHHKNKRNHAYDCKGSPMPPKVTLLIVMNSSMPYLLPSRPNPLCLTPPKLLQC